MGQLNLFPEPVSPPPASTIPTLESVRARLDVVMAALRSPGGPAWSAKERAMWQVVVPQMANWLPQDERDAVRAEFARLIG